MKRVIIIGCGYGGISAAWRLAGFRKTVEVAVIDRGRDFNFLPLVPDCLGRGIPAQCLAYPIQELGLKYNFRFIHGEVTSLELAAKKVFTAGQAWDYDYLIIASGSETNFYGNEAIRQQAYKLDNAADAERLLSGLGERDYDAYLVAGGGYTGIEVASNLRIYLKRRAANKRIIIIERAPSLLGVLPAWIQSYVGNNLRSLDIEVLTNSVIENLEGSRVVVSGGRAFENSLVVWAAGVRTADFLQNLAVNKNAQGRIMVDEYLRLNDNCFVVGDAANFTYKGAYLRMAVQFAVAQGGLAALNIVNTIEGRRLKEYRPHDLGYIIPMANNKSCGNILGLNVKGLLPTLAHYLMAVYRSWGWENKVDIIKALTKEVRYVS